MDTEMKEYIITWFIENYGYCWHENGQTLISPEFTADCLEGTAWTLQLYPRGFNDERKDSISLFLYRSAFDDGPDVFPLKYELSILAADELPLRNYSLETPFEKENGFGVFSCLDLIDKFWMPEDIVRVRLKMRGQGSIQNMNMVTARTRIEIEQVSFHHEVECFSSLKLDEKKTIQINLRSGKGLNLSSSLCISDDSFGKERIFVEVTPLRDSYILMICTVYVLDPSGGKIKCGEIDNRIGATFKEIKKIPLTVTKALIVKRKGKYLQDDKLSLLCECTFSTGIDYKKIEKTVHEIPLNAINDISKCDKYSDKYAEKLNACPSALNGLKGIYDDQFLTDIKLKTETKSFSVHKNVLYARSPVFKMMLTNDMKEKNTDCIQIDDLEDDVVQKFLIFLYSDALENLDWDSAIKLYYAGDKYQVEKLMLLCSSFLLKNVSTSNVSELLLLAATHSDSDLKKFVEDFIFEHEEEVFASDEWGSLIGKNPILASNTMRQKYLRKL